MEIVAEFERLRVLVYASMVASVVAMVLFIAFAIYLARKAKPWRKLFASHPWRVRLRAVFALGSGWEASVDKEHLDALRAGRRTGRLLLASYLVWIAFHFGNGALRRHWLERVEVLGNEVAAEARRLGIHRE